MMTDLSPEARDLLRAARSFDDPSDADSRRVRATVLARAGAAVGIGAAIGATFSSFSFAGVDALLGSTAAKIGAAVLVVAGLSAGSHVATRALLSEPAPVIVTEAPKVFVGPPAQQPSATIDEPLPVDAQLETTGKGKISPSHGARTRRQTPDLDGEARLLEQADADLRRGDTEAALDRLNDHATRYPSGALAEEREGVRAIALCRGGKGEGKLLADRILGATHKSALANRVRAACGIEKGE